MVTLSIDKGISKYKERKRKKEKKKERRK